MAKKKKKKYVITSQQMFDFNKVQYNAWGVGHGAHKNKKAYDRKRYKISVRDI